MYRLKKFLRRFTPAPILSVYHLSLAHLGALIYGFPSRDLIVIGVTGTNGKTSTTEYINAMFEAAGRVTAVSNSIRVKVAGESRPSTGRSMPGRFFIQGFMRDAKRRGCTVVIIEMTSEGVKQHRHRGVALDALVFTNLAPEHIESHGSYEAYADAKFAIGLALAQSGKRPRTIVANADDEQGARYLALSVEKRIGFRLEDARPYSTNDRGSVFRFKGADIAVAIPGEFYIKNALAAALVVGAFGVGDEAIQAGIDRVKQIPGRMERIDAGQDFSVIVDYALTPDALEAVYKTYGDQKKICIFGSAGGGRDKWKRPILGKIAEENCETVILTNDVAYGEDAAAIMGDIARGMTTKPEIIPDRREAIRRGIEIASKHRDPRHTAVLITGMGIDTEITDPSGEEIPWSDVSVAREELEKTRSLWKLSS